MATPMNADQFLAALKAEGLRIAEHTGWRTHNRAGHGGWGPVNAVMIHHTAGSGPGDASVVWSGRSDLPGPLAHGYLAKTGTVTMTANGRANHAGGGDPAVLAAVVNETYVTAPPAPKFHDGSGGATDGNAHFYGLEISNLGNGKDVYPDVQWEAAVKWAAAICRHHGWSSKSVIGHKEWSDWKSDPSFDIKKFRADVATALALKAGAWKLHPATTKEDDVPTGPEIAKDVLDYDGVPASRVLPNADSKTNPTWTVRYALQTGVESARSAQLAAEQANTKIDALAKQVTALAVAVAALKQS